MTLLQTTIPTEKFFVPIAVVLITLVVGLWIVSRVKRRLQDQDESADLSGGFTLSDLREMVRRGEMSPEEFDRAKTKVIAAARKVTDAAEEDADAPPTDPQP